MALVTYRQDDCTGPYGVSIGGRLWSDGRGRWQVVVGDFVYDANRIRNASVTPSTALAVDANLPAGLDDQRIEANVTDFNQLVVRYDSVGDNYYMAYVIGGSVYLYRVDGGVATFLDSGPWSGSGSKLALEAVGTAIRVYEGGFLRASVTDAVLAVGDCGIRIVEGGQYFDNIEIFIDATLVTTPAPTSAPGSTVAPTTPPPPGQGVVGAGYTAIAFPSGSFAMGTLGPNGSVVLTAGSTATDILTGACWDADGNVYFAYKVGAAVRIARYDGQADLVADWDIALETMQSSDGRAMLDWHDGSLWVWVHNVVAEGNLPQIYELNPLTGVVLGGGPWSGPSRSPSASVDAAAPSGADFGYYPSIRVSANRLWLLGMGDDRTDVFLEIINKASKAQVANITLQSDTIPDESYPRGLALDPVNEYCFVHWARYNDGTGDDEVKRASYDSDGVLRWALTTAVLNWHYIGGVAYDVTNDQLYIGGGISNFNIADEPLSVVSPASGGHLGGAQIPNPGTVVLNVGMNALDAGVIISNGGTIFRYTPALTNPEEWFTILAATSRVMRTDYLYADVPATSAPTTPAPTSNPGTGVTTPAVTTPAGPTTPAELTFPPVTTPVPVTTPAPATTPAPTTLAPTTGGPTSYPGTTEPPTLDGDQVGLSLSYVQVMDQLVGRSWVKNDEGKVRDDPLIVDTCIFALTDELGVRLEFRGVVDELGSQYVRFVIPQARLLTNHIYIGEVSLDVNGGPTVGPSIHMIPVN